MMESFDIVVRCQAEPLKHAKVIRISGRDEDFVQTLAACLDGSSELYIYKPGALSPIGKCATCGAALRSEVKETEHAVVAQ